MNNIPMTKLRSDALAIWRAAVAVVDSARLVEQAVRVEGHELVVAGERLDLREIERIAVVGGGKAGAGMAAGLEAALGFELLLEKRVAGWLNVPEDCVRTLRTIHLHGARPPGRNEPTAQGVLGSEKILELVASLGTRDLCLCLLSGGGSALLPAPVPAISLADKQVVTRFLSDAGANIAELNTVRKQLSRIKGGGLWRACRAGRLITLVISDVIGDPLEIIGSGPTVADPSTPGDALAILERYGGRRAELSSSIFAWLQRGENETEKLATSEVQNVVIGNNALAVDAAGSEAERLGYSHVMMAATALEGPAEDVGRHLAGMALHMRSQAGPNCLITGGEPVVKLVDVATRGMGGRNQQLVLAATEVLWPTGSEGIVLLSGGTDGEDGPTDAAGALVDADIILAARERGLDPHDFLSRNDAYHFFEPLGGLIKTGPTHTNVCDVRVALASRNHKR